MSADSKPHSSAELLARAAREPLGVDISDFSDEYAAGFLAGQVNALEESGLLEQLEAAMRAEEQLEHSIEDVASLTSKNLSLIEQLEACRAALAFYDPAEDVDAALEFAQRALSSRDEA